MQLQYSRFNGEWLKELVEWSRYFKIYLMKSTFGFVKDSMNKSDNYT